ncbi:MAG: hypothetical protein ABI056_08500 [Caulobacteraceae bacterium]
MSAAQATRSFGILALVVGTAAEAAAGAAVGLGATAAGAVAAGVVAAF